MITSVLKWLHERWRSLLEASGRIVRPADDGADAGFRLPWRRAPKTAASAGPPEEKPTRAPEPEPEKAWTRLSVEEMPISIPLRIQRDIAADPPMDEEPVLYGRLADLLGDGRGDVVVLERPIRERPEEVRLAHRVLEDPWLPTPATRVAPRDFRRGYRHIWQIQDTLSKIRRPYLLRLDLARVPYEDLEPVERCLVTVPLGERGMVPTLEPPPMLVASGPLKPVPKEAVGRVAVLEPVPLASEAMEGPSRGGRSGSKRASS